MEYFIIPSHLKRIYKTPKCSNPSLASLSTDACLVLELGPRLMCTCILILNSGLLCRILNPALAYACLVYIVTFSQKKKLYSSIKTFLINLINYSNVTWLRFQVLDFKVQHYLVSELPWEGLSLSPPHFHLHRLIHNIIQDGLNLF